MKRLSFTGLRRFFVICLLFTTLGVGNILGAVDTGIVLDSTLPTWAKMLILFTIIACGGGVVIGIKNILQVHSNKQNINTKGDNSPASPVNQDGHGNNLTQITTGDITISNTNTLAQQKEEEEDDYQDYTKAKLKTHILFVDDKDDFTIMQSIKDAGWKNVEYLNDITNLDCDELKIADIVFVDITGVGTKMYKKEGIGLAVAIKQRYKSKKKVILYSADSNGDRFDPDLRKVDYLLYKEGETNQYINLIENFCHE